MQGGKRERRAAFILNSVETITHESRLMIRTTARRERKKHYLRIFIRNKIMDSAENENVQRVQFACVCEIGMVS